MTQSVRNYFISSNSADGYVSFFQSNFGGLHSVIRLGGYPSMVASDLLSGICVRAREKGFHPDLVHDCLDNSLAGIIVPERSIGILNIPLYDQEAYSLVAILNDENLEKTNACLDIAYKQFAEAMKIHAGLEILYISNINYSEADQFAEEMAEKLIGSQRLEKTGKAFDRFFGAAAVEGPAEYVDNLTADIGKRYFIKGHDATGKSAFLKRIAKSAALAGFDTELYHHPIDPGCLNMIVVRELDFCLFDSAPPYAYFPSRPGDETMERRHTAGEEKIDEKYRAEIAAISSDYKAKIAKAVKQIGKAKRYYEEVQRSYLSKVDAQALETVEERLQNSVFG